MPSANSVSGQLTSSFTGGLLAETDGEGGQAVELMTSPRLTSMEITPSDQADEPDPEMRMPPVMSLVAVCAWLGLCTAVFIAAVPTVLNYVKMLGGNENIAGAVIAAVPFGTSIVQPIWAVYLFRRVPLRTVRSARRPRKTWSTQCGLIERSSDTPPPPWA